LSSTSAWSTRTPIKIVHEKHVFIAGLARAGTTILMRRFYASQAFRSLTYRDMPFVLAPTLWRKLAAQSGRNLVTAERAHGDGILVDIDSPESFEEVFLAHIRRRRLHRRDAFEAAFAGCRNRAEVRRLRQRDSARAGRERLALSLQEQ
jgi:hypothetical protein